MKVFITFTPSRLTDATIKSLFGYDTYYINMREENSYLEYFKERWKEGKSFINVEHDVIPWPGALDEIEHCQEPWCGYGYLKFEKAGSNPYLGCVKISVEMIKMIPDVWSDREKYSVCWGNLDVHLAEYAKKCSIKFHQHFPSVTHLRKV
jgi:hypothetical protein